MRYEARIFGIIAFDCFTRLISRAFIDDFMPNIAMFHDMLGHAQRGLASYFVEGCDTDEMHEVDCFTLIQKIFDRELYAVLYCCLRFYAT